MRKIAIIIFLGLILSSCQAEPSKEDSRNFIWQDGQYDFISKISDDRILVKSKKINENVWEISEELTINFDGVRKVNSNYLLKVEGAVVSREVDGDSSIYFIVPSEKKASKWEKKGEIFSGKETKEIKSHCVVENIITLPTHEVSLFSSKCEYNNGRFRVLDRKIFKRNIGLIKFSQTVADSAGEHLIQSYYMEGFAK